MSTAAERIAAWAELAESATKGPWEDWRGNGGGVYITTAANGIRGLYTCAATNPSAEQWQRLEDDAAHIAASRTAVPAMAAALTAVLGLHLRYCEGCEMGGDADHNENCTRCYEPWPCLTVTAIETALGVTA